MSAALESEVLVDGPLPAEFREIFELHAPMVRRYLAHRMRDRSATDEATQETFIRAMRRLPTLRDPQRLGAWLRGIARRVSAEQNRTEERRNRLALRAVNEDLSPSDPERVLLERERVQRTLEAVEALRPDRKEALRLLVDEERGYNEIASELGWSLPKVKNEIHRARLELKATIAGSLGVLLLVLSLGSPGVRGHAGVDDTTCFESGIGAVAAIESRHQACLMASPCEAPASADFSEEIESCF